MASAIDASQYTELQLWLMFAELHETYGNFESTKDVYEEMLSQETIEISPQVFLNYAAFLERYGHLEEAFEVYEQGLTRFQAWPARFDIWRGYLESYGRHHQSTRDELDLVHELCERCLVESPAEYHQQISLLYHTIEQNFEHMVSNNSSSSSSNLHHTTSAICSM